MMSPLGLHLLQLKLCLHRTVEMEGTNAATASSLESGLSHILQAQLQLQEQVLE
jgi:hypothetical protein